MRITTLMASPANATASVAVMVIVCYYLTRVYPDWRKWVKENTGFAVLMIIVTWGSMIGAAKEPTDPRQTRQTPQPQRSGFGISRPGMTWKPTWSTACTMPDGTIIRETSTTITNSYPDTVTVSLQSGDYECYWFRCIVPERFANNGHVMDWNGEALFGSPAGSGKGFDLAGTIVIDNQLGIWAGRSDDIDFGGGEIHAFTNGINVTEVLTDNGNGTEEM